MAAKLCFSVIQKTTKSFPTKRLCCSMAAPEGYALNMDTLNPNIIKMEYAVRGPILIRAGEIEKELKNGVQKPFTEVIRANLGDCHAMGQIPITFIRQILALTVCPALFDDPRFPDDVKQKAKIILDGCRGGSVGSYSDAAGIEIIRRHVAQFIERRDGIPSNWEDIILSTGVSDGIYKILKLFICKNNGKTAGVMVPIPQYPIYSALIAEFGLHLIGYYLDESHQWALCTKELQRAIDQEREKCNPRVIVVINPGNPTGQVLSRENIEEIIRFAHKERLFIIADEVYQYNIYGENSQFHSFKKVSTEMGEPYSSMELVSFMSISKGYTGECGIRGGYTEVRNMCPEVKKMYLKANTAMLCSTVLGQVALDAMVNPPQEGEPSYPLFIKEKQAVLDSLKLRAKMMVDAFNSFEGFSCNEVQGAMYAFPQITLPPKAIEAAQAANMAPDTFYAFQLLENTGICVVSGSGFGQQPGTYHFRTTILPPVEKMKLLLERFQEFHKNFIDKYK